jgi:GT2 family glycosyltransferase
MLLNNDTIVKDHAFDQMVDFMDKSVDIGACGPKLLNLDGSIQHQGGLLSKRFWRSSHPVAVDFLIGACLMVRREVLGRVGLMDEKLFFYNDDLDWCRRIRQAGWQIYFLPQATLVHYGGASSNKKQFNRQLFTEGFMGGLYFTRKHYGELAYHLYRSLLVLTTLLVLPFMIRNKDKLRAYTDILLIAAYSRVPKP